MIIYPAIDLRRGHCVRLSQGRFDAETVYGDDPVAVARGFAAQGAKWLHVVDLDGALDASKRQLEVVSAIIRESGLRVQCGGGIRGKSDVYGLLAAGAERVVIGSLCVKMPETVRAWIEEFGAGKIVPALDVRVDEAGVARVSIAGWQQDSTSKLEDMLLSVLPNADGHLLCTDIARDGMLKGPNVALYAALRQKFPALQVQASGGVSSLEDLAWLRGIGTAGTIVGRALYEGKFTLKEALG
ncbi:MAG TPA: 1-(5-phosphoribosyl)-5-[(5-phosphoribosylamino)methylideneamino]imidazole-4-carboxamide isomerase [Opitutaceae bacterium]